MNKEWKQRVLSMNENEWNQFRVNKWKQTRKYLLEHRMPPPDFFLKTKNDYIRFCESRTAQAKVECIINTTNNSAQNVLQKLFEMIEKPEEELNKKMFVKYDASDKEWEEYRQWQWKRWSDNNKSNEPPADFLKDREKYGEKLNTISNLRTELLIAKTDVFLAERREEQIQKELDELKRSCYFDKNEVKQIDTSTSDKLLVEHYEKLKTQRLIGKSSIDIWKEYQERVKQQHKTSINKLDVAEQSKEEFSNHQMENKKE